MEYVIYKNDLDSFNSGEITSRLEFIINDFAASLDPGLRDEFLEKKFELIEIKELSNTFSKTYKINIVGASSGLQEGMDQVKAMVLCLVD
jgi:hypothetical protein